MRQNVISRMGSIQVSVTMLEVLVTEVRHRTRIAPPLPLAVCRVVFRLLRRLHSVIALLVHLQVRSELVARRQCPWTYWWVKFAVIFSSAVVRIASSVFLCRLQHGLHRAC